jgi:hypothetical protein
VRTASPCLDLTICLDYSYRITSGFKIRTELNRKLLCGLKPQLRSGAK